MEYRLANLSDLKNVASLHAKSWQQTYSGILSDEYLDKKVLEDRLGVWHERLAHKNGNQTLLLAEENNNLLGFICLMEEPEKERVLLDNLHVDESYKGRGIGKELIARALASLDGLKGRGLYLEVLAKNENAIRFYERLKGVCTESNTWSSPCGNDVKEFVYFWPSAVELLELLKRKVEIKQS